MSDGFFIADIPPDVDAGAFIELTGSEAHHAAVVRRLRRWERLTVTDGLGRGVTAVAVDVDPKRVVVRVCEVLLSRKNHPLITVVQALPKNDRAALAVDLMTEVGVDRIVPWQAARSIVKWSSGASSRQKWVAAARESSKQARRLRFPIVEDAVTTTDVAEMVRRSGLGLIMHEKEVVPLVACDLAGIEQCLIVIGPEGGLTGEEVDLFQRAGGQTYSLGSTVLRASTAGAVAAAKVQALWAMAQRESR